MSTAQNNIATERADRLIVPIAASTAINQGDFLEITSNLGVASSTASDTAIGIVDDTNPIASLGGDNNPNLRGAAGAVSVVPIGKYKGCAIVFLPLADGRTSSFFDQVLRTANAQIVSDTGGGTAIGRCLELTTFTGDGSTRMKVLLCGAN